MELATGLEPATDGLQNRCATVAPRQHVMVRPIGLEPMTIRLWGGCSHQLNYGHVVALLTVFIVADWFFFVSKNFLDFGF